MRRIAIVAGESAAFIGQRMWLTTGDVAKMLGVSPRWVRWLARHGALSFELTESGQRVFRRSDIHRAERVRMDARARRRPALLVVARIRMLKADTEPRQLALFARKSKLKAVPRPAPGERSLPHAEAKATGSFEKRHESDTGDYVDRPIAVGGSRPR